MVATNDPKLLFMIVVVVEVEPGLVYDLKFYAIVRQILATIEHEDRARSLMFIQRVAQLLLTVFGPLYD